MSSRAPVEETRHPRPLRARGGRGAAPPWRGRAPSPRGADRQLRDERPPELPHAQQGTVAGFVWVGSRNGWIAEGFPGSKGIAIDHRDLGIFGAAVQGCGGSSVRVPGKQEMRPRGEGLGSRSARKTLRAPGLNALGNPSKMYVADEVTARRRPHTQRVRVL